MCQSVLWSSVHLTSMLQPKVNMFQHFPLLSLFGLLSHMFSLPYVLSYVSLLCSSHYSHANLISLRAASRITRSFPIMSSLVLLLLFFPPFVPAHGHRDSTRVDRAAPLVIPLSLPLSLVTFSRTIARYINSPM